MLVLKWREPTNNLAEQYSNAPNVGLVGVPGVKHHFWSAIAGSSTVGIGPILMYILYILRKTKVNQLDMAILVKQYVLRLEISIYDAHLMEGINRQNDLADVKPCLLLSHEHIIPYQLEEFAARQKVQNHVQVHLVLERFVYVAAKILWFELFQDVPFVHNVLNLFFAANVFLVQTLHGVVLLGFGVLHQLHDAE